MLRNSSYQTYISFSLDNNPHTRYNTPMPNLNLKPTHKPIRDYYATLQQYEQHDVTHEGAVSAPFETLLNICARQVNATLILQYAMRTATDDRIVIDGAVINEYGIPIAYWEAKIKTMTSSKRCNKTASGLPI